MLYLDVHENISLSNPKVLTHVGMYKCILLTILLQKANPKHGKFPISIGLKYVFLLLKLPISDLTKRSLKHVGLLYDRRGGGGSLNSSIDGNPLWSICQLLHIMLATLPLSKQNVVTNGIHFLSFVFSAKDYHDLTHTLFCDIPVQFMQDKPYVQLSYTCHKVSHLLSSPDLLLA